MQGSYLSQWGQPDIRTAILFLCGRLVNPDCDYCKKLTHLIHYLYEAIYMALILGIDETKSMN